MYTFDTNGQLVQFGLPNNPIVKYEYDNNKNRTSVKYYFGGAILTVIEKYKYDQSLSPQSLIPRFKGHPAEAFESVLENRSPHTIINESLINLNSDGSIWKQIEIPYTVVYNSSGLVVSKTWRSLTKPKNFKNYTYTYQ